MIFSFVTISFLYTVVEDPVAMPQQGYTFPLDGVCVTALHPSDTKACHALCQERSNCSSSVVYHNHCYLVPASNCSEMATLNVTEIVEVFRPGKRTSVYH